MSQQTCPDRREWADFLLGKLPLQQLDAMSAHLAVCPACLELTEQLGESDDLLVACLKLSGDDAYIDEVEYQRAIVGVRAIAHELAFSQAETDDSAQPTQPELQVLRDYELLDVLGEGGMGTVYRARHRRLGRLVAVKILKPDRAGAAAFARFDREMKAIGSLDHPHIVRAHDAGEVNGIHYLAMELVEGTDLATLTRDQGRLPVAEACEIIRQAAWGLDHAHRHGLVHRDMKPSNLLLAADGTVKVLDLGLALLHSDESPDELTSAGQVMGTLDYMAPEQARDTHLVDRRADLYSLGCTLYRLLAGRPPFAGRDRDSAAKKLLAHQAADAPELTTVRPEIPPDLSSLVERMLAKSPDERPATAQEVAQVLAPFAEGACLTRLLTDGPFHGEREVPAASERRHTHDRSKRWLLLGGLGLALAVLGMALTSNGLITSAPRTVHLDRADLGEVGAYRRHTAGVTCVAVSPDGRQVLSGDADGGLHLWDLATGQPIRQLVAHQGALRWVVFSHDGQVALSASDDTDVKRWELSTGKLADSYRGHTKEAMSVALAPDGQRFASCGFDNRVLIWEPESAQPVTSLGYRAGERLPVPRSIDDLKQLDGHVAWVRTVAWSPDGGFLVTGGNEALIALWDARTGRLFQRLVGHLAPVAQVAISPDGRQILSGGFDHRVILWDRATGDPVHILTGHTAPATGVAFSPDGRQALSCSEDGTLRLWDLDAGAERRQFTGHTAAVAGVALTPDGKFALTAGGDRIVRVWRVASELSAVAGREDHVDVLRSPDSQ